MSFDQLVELLDTLDPVFAVFRLVGPILMLGLALCLFYVAKSDRSSPHVKPSQSRSVPGVAEDPAPFRQDAPKSKPWFRTNAALGTVFCVTMVAGTIGVVGECKTIFFGSELASDYKGPDTRKFEKIMRNAEARLEDGDAAAAKALYMDALNLEQIALVYAAEPMSGVADILIKEGRFDVAEPLALIAARLHPKEPDYVNIYAEILIEKCRLSDALEVLEGLTLYKDSASERLLEIAEAGAVTCNASPSGS